MVYGWMLLNIISDGNNSVKHSKDVKIYGVQYQNIYSTAKETHMFTLSVYLIKSNNICLYIATGRIRAQFVECFMLNFIKKLC